MFARSRRLGFAVLVIGLAGCQATPKPASDPLEHARQLLREGIVFDGHNDLPWAIREDKTAPMDVVAYDLRGKVPGDTDLKRLREGGVGAQFWSVYIPGELKEGFVRTQLEQIDLAWRMVDRYPEALVRTDTAAGIRAAMKAGLIASTLGIEGGHAIENSLATLRAYYGLGVRYMTLTHNVTLDWADSAADEARHGGLTPFGEEVVREMNRLGMLVDLSHTSVATMDDALRVSKAPVMWSHSNAQAITKVPRNVPDDILRRLPANGGVVMVSFVGGFADSETAKVMQPLIEEHNRLSKLAKTDEERKAIYQETKAKLVKAPRPRISAVADHIEHIRKVAGVDHVGIGADYDGNDLWPVGLEDVSKYPSLFAELIRRGWSDEDLRKLASGNILRALEQAERVARELQETTPASTARLKP